jgi:SAM-dependent methyltransferase
LRSDAQRVHDYWNEASCGEDLYLRGSDLSDYEAHALIRYELEPYIAGFADFEGAKGKRVLEIGVGLGADHIRFAEAGADLFGIDLTERAVEHTAQRLTRYGLSSMVQVGDAERLAFPDEYFDRVYSWGVLHHSPSTPDAIREVLRVLKPGGQARVMIYHKWSLVGLMLWARYGLLRMRPWMSLREVYDRYLESPGTKAYSITEARTLCSGFRDVEIETVLTHGDLLESSAGQRHEGGLLAFSRRVWPRFLIKRWLPGMGLFMLIRAVK